MKPNAHGAASRSLTLKEGNGLSVCASFAIDGEGGRVAAIDYALLDAVGEILAEGSRLIRSYPDANIYQARLALPAESVREDLVWDAMLDLGETVALRWRIDLRGEGGERLARKSLWTMYREEDLVSSNSKG